MNEQLQWTLQATCSECSCESLAALHMGLTVHCPQCGSLVQIDPTKTIFHRSDGSGYGKVRGR